MKKTFFSFIISLATLLVMSCQQDDLEGNVGYLRVEVGTNSYVSTRIADEYNPQQIALQIVNSKGEIVTSTDDWETLAGTQLRLPAGVYTLNASSNGFDGSESGYDIPYYAGSEQVTVQTGKEVTANIVCTLANVKVTVNYDESFQQFKTATTEVASALEGVAALNFTMNEELKPGYFPVGDLNVTVNVTNNAGQSHSQTTNITDVKARKHYILNFKVAEAGSINKPTVTINGEEIVYSFTFNVSTEAATKLSVEQANAWSNFAYVRGSIESQEAGTELDAANMTFEYKATSDEEWTSIVAQVDGANAFKATLTNLKPGTQYSYRMAYNGGSDAIFKSDASNFTTENQEVVPNLSFDDWCTVKNAGLIGTGNTYYATSDYNNLFWDSGNEGANTLSVENPTQPEETDVISGKAAKLTSKVVASIQFAAGSLFTGDFGSASLSPLGAYLDFGRPFTGRPSQLKGYYKYNPVNINYIDTERVTAVQKGDRDLCSIYILLADWEAPFAVSTGDNKFVDINDPSVIAYGELGADKTSPESMANYEEFTIDIKYRDITRKPTYILIVCSSSKYGDYFTGGKGSTLLLDEFQLVYGEPVLE